MISIAHSTFYALKKNTWKAERTPKLVIFLEISKTAEYILKHYHESQEADSF